MDQLKSKKWWQATGTRAIKTVAETAVSTIGVAAVMGEVNWVLVCSASVLSGIVCILTCLKGLPEVKLEQAE